MDNTNTNSEGQSAPTTTSNESKTFWEVIFDSIYQPGQIPSQLILVINVSLIGLILILGSMILTGYKSIHLYIMLALAIFVFISVQW
jgi:hypothetical protein